LPCAWVGEAALSDGMVSIAELKADDVALCCNDLLRVKFETRLTVLAGTNKDGMVDGRDEGGSESCDDGD